MKWHIVAAAVAVLALGGTGIWALGGRDTAEPVTFDPVTYQPPQWEAILTGPDATGVDNPAQAAADRKTAQVAAIDALGSDLQDASSAETVARNVVTAAVSGTGRAQWPGWFAQTTDDPSGCRNVTIDATNAVALPYAAMGNQTWAKVLVAWDGDCPRQLDTYTPVSGLNTAYVYLARAGDTWNPVRPANLPRAAGGQDGGTIDPTLLDPLEGCTRNDLLARIEVADAWRQLCQAAQQAGVTIEAVDAWRSGEQQADLYRQAIDAYGDDADMWVAYADETRCTSKHCAGVAIDIERTDEALAWLASPAGCLVDGQFVDADACLDGSPTVSVAARWGFTQPLRSNPGHLEYAGPVARIGPTSDCTSQPRGPVPSQIAQVWRCRLERAGATEQAVADTVAKAVVVSRCESNWDPAFLAFDGAFVDNRHPDTGAAYDAAGLFGMNRAYTRVYGGDTASWFDPQVAADVAAQAWLEEETYGRDGWRLFGCVAGDGIRPGGLLDDPIPAWAYQY